MTALRLLPLAALLALLGTSPAHAQLKAAPGDWPAWRGPDRTGVSTETGLFQTWPKGGPTLLWKTKGLGTGYGSLAVVGDRIYLMGTDGGAQPKAKGKGKGMRGGGAREVLIALDTRDGKRVWAIPFGQTAGGYPAPRCTPTVDGDSIYALSSDGKLICADRKAGAVRWKKDLRADFGGQPGGWAYAESPLIDGDVLVCTPGGNKATLVALNKKTGAPIWRAAVGDRAAYSSAIVAEVGGTRQYVQFLSGGVVGVSAADGKLLWRYDAPANTTANCSTPIFRDGCVFAASAYRTGGGKAKITKDGTTFSAKEEFFLDSFQNQHGGMVLVGDYIYGTNNGSLLCVNFKDGTVVWTARSVGKGSITYADGHLIVRSEGGAVALVEATPQGYKEKGRFSQPDRSSQRAWSYPVVAGGKLYLRDWDNLFVYDIKAK
jgi:outer membrane protein assembly factor BamB